MVFKCQLFSGAFADFLSRRFLSQLPTALEAWFYYGDDDDDDDLLHKNFSGQECFLHLINLLN